MRRHREKHRINRTGWLRAAVLGANDGILSTASLVVGVGASGADRHAILIAGVAGLVAGAFSMAAGEYVSVSSQADLEAADLAQEHAELADDPHGEEAELAAIHHARGLSWETARQVARELTAHDPLAAHARDELGITDSGAARPVQAAVASAASFSVGAAVPVALAIVSSHALVLPVVTIGVLVTLCILGAVSAAAGGASQVRGALRVLLWGALAMAATALIGHLAGTTV
ncbi:MULTISPECIES: VIT1/CCC1 transporter family protein [Sphingomonas]|jgi:vacuolar iron transporter family protein|uniref:VIT1/CCC1 transporter family protein n=1 Tax=Sphingomonas TaxID=13687 RepID=UPI00193BBFEF|nr:MULTISPECIES: VIT family protein [Sphingomonas]